MYFGLRFPSHRLIYTSEHVRRLLGTSLVGVQKMHVRLFNSRRNLGTSLADASPSSSPLWMPLKRASDSNLFRRQLKPVQTCSTLTTRKENLIPKYLKDEKIVPYAPPPSPKDIDLLYQFFDRSNKMVVLTGAGMSTECGIPDYRSPNGAYSSGFKPITHQEFLRSGKARRRYWARSYAGWRRFIAAQPGAGHFALATLEKAGRISFMITQNVDRLHHRAGSNPLELHGTVYTVACLECGFSLSRHIFQEQLKTMNPKWAEAIDSLVFERPGSEKSFGMRIRPDADIEIDEKFWEEDFCIPTCPECDGVLKPEVVFFGDNVPIHRAEKAMEEAKECDAFLVLGSSVMTMSAFRLVRAAHEAGAATAIVNIGATRADTIVPLKIHARCGEVLQRLLNTGSLSIPAV